MAPVNPMMQYQTQREETATPGMVTVMLFEEIIKNINIASKAIDDNNIQDSHDALVKAENIYLTLANFLDERFEISKSLLRMYEFLASRIIDANMRKDKEILKEVMEFTVDFRDTWRQAEKHLHIEQTGGRINVKSVKR